MRRSLAHLPTALAILIVLVGYAFFGSVGTFSFRRTSWERTGDIPFAERHYASLAEAFLRGQLHLPYVPDARWSKVNPYDQRSRATQGLEWEMWDASLYRGRFYLYFSPVPVLLFYIPFRLVAGAYPPDALAAAVMCAWAFLACVAFARRALADRKPYVPFPIWVLLIGLGNVIPFMLTHVRAYEVAIATGMAMTAMWAYALLRWTESGARRHAVWMAVWLALAIATRPNLIVLLAVFVFVLVERRASLRRCSGQAARRALVAWIPLAVVGAAVALYNYLRFGSLFELGMTYQISFVPMWRVAPCSLCDVPDALRFVNTLVHYLFWSPTFASVFPYVDLQRNVLDPAGSFAGGPEQVVGAFALNPLTLIGTAAALMDRRQPAGRSAGSLPAVSVMSAAWLILLTLSTCRWVTARYALDFLLLLTIASVVSIERLLSFLSTLDVRTRPLAIATSLIAVFSIVVGLLLGFRGPDRAFEKKNPALFRATMPPQ